MDIDFNGETIEVPVPDGFMASDCIVIVRSVSLDEPGVDSLSMGITASTGGILQHGMLSLISSSEGYVGAEWDEDD